MENPEDGMMMSPGKCLKGGTEKEKRKEKLTFWSAVTPYWLHRLPDPHLPNTGPSFNHP
jgi:hypothetical protein